MSELDKFKSETAIAITAFDRPDCLLTLLESIQQYYPGMQIHIADDGFRPSLSVDKMPRNCTYHLMPFNVGLSAKRNHLVDHITQPYILLMDDDFVIRNYTHLDKLYAILTNNKLDMVAGWARRNGQQDQYAGFIARDGNTVTLSLLPDIVHGGMRQDWYQCDLVQNFFLARTDALRIHKWDPSLRMCEHWEYFYRTKDTLKIGYCPAVIVEHMRPEQAEVHYANYRRDVWPSLVLGLEKHNVETLITPSGNYNITNLRARVKSIRPPQPPQLPQTGQTQAQIRAQLNSAKTTQAVHAAILANRSLAKMNRAKVKPATGKPLNPVLVGTAKCLRV